MNVGDKVKILREWKNPYGMDRNHGKIGQLIELRDSLDYPYMVIIGDDGPTLVHEVELVETIGMNFIEAVAAMKERKKVRRNAFNWKDIESIRMLPTTIIIYNKTGEKVYLNGDDFEATDWEIVEEKKTLSDKFLEDDDRLVWVKDVKQFVKDLKYFMEVPRSQKDYEEHIDKLAGERLIK